EDRPGPSWEPPTERTPTMTEPPKAADIDPDRAARQSPIARDDHRLLEESAARLDRGRRDVCRLRETLAIVAANTTVCRRLDDVVASLESATEALAVATFHQFPAGPPDGPAAP